MLLALRNYKWEVLTLLGAVVIALVLAFSTQNRGAYGTGGDLLVDSAKDTKLQENDPTTNYATDTSIAIDGDQPDGTGKDKRALVEWDVSTIPSDATVDEAVMTFDTSESANVVNIHEVLKEWNETEATWNKATSSVNWSTAGAKGASDIASATEKFGPVTDGTIWDTPVQLDAAMVQKWVDNSADNHGVLLEMDDGTSDEMSIHTREAASGEPELQVFYTEAPAQPSDTTNPTESITGGPTGTTTNDSPSFTFSANDTSIFYCSIQPTGGQLVDGEECTSGLTYDNLPDGEYTFNVVAEDDGGNVGAGASRTFTVDVNDAAAPDTNLTTATTPQKATFNISTGANDDAVDRGSSSVYPPNTTINRHASDSVIYTSKGNNGQYAVWNSLFKFDTSSLPDNATITSAKLRATATAKDDTTADNRSFALEYYQWDGTNSDWTATSANNAHAGTDLGSISTGSAQDYALQNLTNVSKNGTTYLRGHITGGQPTGPNYVGMAAQENTTYAEPQLEVEYTTPETATFNISAGANDDAVDRGSSSVYPPNTTINRHASDTEVYASKGNNGLYAVWNPLFKFDTSSLPDNAAVTSAKFRATATAKDDTGADNRSFALEYYQWDGTNSDWTEVAANNAHGGTDLGDISTGSARDYALQNLANVSTNGNTYLRGHITGGQPTGPNYLGLATLEHTTHTEPQLIVNYTTPSEASFAFSGSNGASTYECRLFNDANQDVDTANQGVLTPWESCTSTKTYTDLYPGEYRFEVRAVDGSGVQDPTPVSYSFTVGGEVTSDLEGEALSKSVTGSDLAVVGDGSASGGQAMAFTGSTDRGGDVVSPAQTAEVTITAKGVNSGGSYPTMNVYVDNEPLNATPISVNSSSYSTFTVPVTLPPAEYDFAIGSPNANNSGRTLTIDKIEFKGE